MLQPKQFGISRFLLGNTLVVKTKKVSINVFQITVWNSRPKAILEAIIWMFLAFFSHISQTLDLYILRNIWRTWKKQFMYKNYSSNYSFIDSLVFFDWLIDRLIYKNLFQLIWTTTQMIISLQIFNFNKLH